MKKIKHVSNMKLLGLLLLTTGTYTACATKPVGMAPQKPRQTAAIPVDNKVDFPTMGLTFVLKDKTDGAPVAAIFDKSGEFYPEIQGKINKKIKSTALVGFTVVNSEVVPENKIYKDSQETYATLVINAKTINGLNKKEQPLRFVVPVERMVITENGGKTNGLGYWNTTDVRPLDPGQKFPF